MEEVSQSVVDKVMGATTVHENDDVMGMDSAHYAKGGRSWCLNSAWRLSWAGLWSVGGGGGEMGLERSGGSGGWVSSSSSEEIRRKNLAREQ